MRYFNVFIASVVLVLGGCTVPPPENQNPAPEPIPTVKVQILFQYEIIDKDDFSATRAGIFVVGAWDNESKPSTWESEGIMHPGPHSVQTTTPFAQPLTYDERTVVVATAFDAYVQSGDKMNCWVVKDGIELRGSKRSFYATTGIPVLHGACSYLVGIGG